MTTQDRLNRLARLYNRATCYELAAINVERRVLIAYCGRRSRSGLLAACRNRGALVIALTGSENIEFGKRASDGATMGPWQIRFTGRTERDAIMEGELEYIGSVAQPVIA